MPPSGQRVTSIYVTTDVPLVSGTEAVVATLGGISTWSPDNVVRLSAWASYSAAAGVTNLTLRIRRNNLTGAVVGEAITPAAAASVASQYSIDAEDSPGDVAGQVYVLCATSIGGTGTILTSELFAIVG